MTHANNHTPGRWIARQYRLDAWAIDPGHGMMPIAHVGGSIPVREEDAVSNPTTDANAHLIAAAPELLEATRALLKAYQQLMPGIGAIACHDYTNINIAPIIANRALAKAEGRPT